MDGKFNVASAPGLSRPIDQLHERAGYQEEQWPNYEGCIPAETILGKTVRRIAIRDRLGELVAAGIDRARPYTKAQKCNFMELYPKVGDDDFRWGF